MVPRPGLLTTSLRDQRTGRPPEGTFRWPPAAWAAARGTFQCPGAPPDRRFCRSWCKSVGLEPASTGRAHHRPPGRSPSRPSAITLVSPPASRQATRGLAPRTCSPSRNRSGSGGTFRVRQALRDARSLHCPCTSAVLRACHAAVRALHRAGNRAKPPCAFTGGEHPPAWGCASLSGDATTLPMPIRAQPADTGVMHMAVMVNIREIWRDRRLRQGAATRPGGGGGATTPRSQ